MQIKHWKSKGPGGTTIKTSTCHPFPGTHPQMRGKTRQFQHCRKSFPYVCLWCFVDNCKSWRKVYSASAISQKTKPKFCFGQKEWNFGRGPKTIGKKSWPKRKTIQQFVASNMLPTRPRVKFALTLPRSLRVGFSTLIKAKDLAKTETVCKGF